MSVDDDKRILDELARLDKTIRESRELLEETQRKSEGLKAAIEAAAEAKARLENLRRKEKHHD